MNLSINKNKYLGCWLAILIFSHFVSSLPIYPSTTEKIPIYATDLQGNPISNLKISDLKLKVNGKQTDITGLRGYFNPSASENATSADSLKSDRMVFIIIDAMFCSHYGLVRTREIANKIVKRGLKNDTYVVLLNTMSEGLRFLIGPEKNKKNIIRAIRKLSLIPGINWLNDMFNSRISYSATGWFSGSTDRNQTYMDGFSAQADRAVDQIDETESITSKSFKGSFEIISKRFSANLIQIQYALHSISQPKIIYLFSEGYQEEALTKIMHIQEKLAGPNISGILLNYFRNFLNTLIDGGAMIHAINPGRLKTDDYNSSGAMNLEFIIQKGGQYIEGNNTDNLNRSIHKRTAAYYELAYSPLPEIKKNQKISITTTRADIKVLSPAIKAKEMPYGQMKINLRKLFALNLITDGSWSRTVGISQKIKTKRISREKREKGTVYEFAVNIPERMQNRSADIFIIAMNRKGNRWGINASSKVLSSQEKLKVFFSNDKKMALFFAIIDSQTGNSIYNQIQ